MAESKINDIIKVSLEKIKDIVGAETIIGSPIETAGGTTIIPVSRVAVGFASGGLDYDADKQDKDKKPSLLASASFSGGGGTGISVSPIGFLVVGKDGRVELLTVDNPNAGDTVDKLVSVIERSPEIIARVKSAFTKKGEDEE
ncbi:MAG: sporulation protein YtfJ [Oscillospiraceae bacterium]|nr:MAG: sporulation protein YtfJ [Oscillospiraceae bacterium]